MATRREIVGVVRPEVDERQLERETSRMERTMSRAAELTPSIDTRRIQRQIERAIPGGGLLGSAVDRLRGRGGGRAAGGGGGGATGTAEAGVQAAQLEVLEDIHDELQKIGASGGVRAEGGGGGGGGSLLTRGLAIRGLMAGGLSLGTAGLAAGSAVGAGSLVGLEQLLQQREQRARDRGQQGRAGTLQTLRGSLDIATNVPTGTTGTGTVTAASGLGDLLANSDPPPWLANIEQVVEWPEPSWLTTIANLSGGPGAGSIASIIEDIFGDGQNDTQQPEETVADSVDPNNVSPTASQLERVRELRRSDDTEAAAEVTADVTVQPQIRLGQANFREALGRALQDERSSIVDEVVREVEREFERARDATERSQRGRRR